MAPLVPVRAGRWSGASGAPDRVPLYQVSGRTGSATPGTLTRIPRARAPSRRAGPARAARRLVVAACGGSRGRRRSTRPAPARPTGRAAGAYPDLEALVPTRYMDQRAGRRSIPAATARLRTSEPGGRAGSRGPVRRRDLDVRRGAGGGPGRLRGARPDRRATARLLSGRAPGPPTGPRSSSATTPTIEGRPGRRLDTQTGPRLQTVVVWPSATADQVNVVISNDLPDARIGLDDADGARFDGSLIGSRPRRWTVDRAGPSSIACGARRRRS